MIIKLNNIFLLLTLVGPYYSFKAAVLQEELRKGTVWQRELRQKIVEGKIPDWMREQISDDFKFFKKGISQEALDQSMKNFNKPPVDCVVIRYRIKNSKLEVADFTREIPFWTSAIKHASFKCINRALEELTKTVNVPDVDFLVCLNDVPTLIQKHIMSVPVLSFTKHKNMDPEFIAIPDFNNNYYISLIDDQSILNEVRLGNGTYPWEAKEPKAFWRGANSGGIYTWDNYKDFQRFKLVDISRKLPHYIDAKFTSLYDAGKGHESLKDELRRLYKGEQTTVAEHMKYKYQMYVDGNACAFTRSYWQMFCNSVILRLESPFIQWYYRAIKPFVHYIPVSEDCADLTKRIDWARSHDNKAREISANANQFANEHLSISDMLYYLYLVLTEYSKLEKISIGEAVCVKHGDCISTFSNQNTSMVNDVALTEKQKLFVLSIPKAGTGLVLKCLNLLTGRDHFNPGLDLIKTGKNLFEFYPEDEILVGHTPHYVSEAVDSLKNQGFKMILAIRDPRDVAISYTFWILNQKNEPTDFNSVLSNIIEKIDQHCRMHLPWQREPLCYTARFENLIGPLGGGSRDIQLQEIRNIAQHIGMVVLDYIIENVADNLFGDTATFRSGKIGSWKSYFTEQHKADFKEKAGQLLIDMGYEKDLSW